MSAGHHREGATPPCPVSVRHGTPRFVFVKDGARVYRCPACGTYVNDVEYRSDTYERSGPDEAGGETAAFVLEKWGFRWSIILAEVERVAPPPATLLDVGAGTGGFVRLALDRGYEAEGLTMSAKEVAFAERELGVRLTLGTLDDHGGPRYDIVSANSVIEHVPDPAGFLRQVADRARPGGYVTLTTPSTNSYQRFLLGARRWRAIRPGHLTVFSPAGLHELCVAQGLEPVRHVTSSMHLKGLGRLGPLRPLARRTLLRVIRLARVGAEQTLTARKRS